MTNDTLDHIGQRAARDLHARVAAVDTEAALGRIGADRGRPTRLRRPVLVAAAVLAVAGIAATGIVRAGSDEDRDAVDTTDQPVVDPAAYGAFTAAYGWDVREWEGCAVLRGARETASCAWVSQHAPANPKALAEFRRRVASLRDGDPEVRWYPF